MIPFSHLKEFPTVLVFDTETTDLCNFKIDTHHPSQPHILQLAYKVYHHGKCVVTEAHMIDSPHESAPAALAVHGKTMDLRKRFGLGYDQVITGFLRWTSQVDLLVAHNLSFDMRMLDRAIQHIFDTNADFYRKGLLAIPTFCTMQNTTSICNVPGPRGAKWPKLNEAYPRLVDPAGFEGAHDALVDVEACAAIFFALQSGAWERNLQNFQLDGASSGLAPIANA